MQKLVYAVFGLIILLAVSIIGVVLSSNSSLRDFFATERISVLAEGSDKFEKDVVINCIDMHADQVRYSVVKTLIAKMTERRPNWRFILLSSNNELDELDSVSNVKLIKLRAGYSSANGLWMGLLDGLTLHCFHNQLVQLRFFNELCIDKQCDLLWTVDVRDELHMQHLPRVSTVYSIDCIDGPEEYKASYSDEERDKVKNCITMSDKVITLTEFTKQRIIDLFTVAPEFVRVIALRYGDNFATQIDKDQISAVLKKYKLQDEQYLLFVPSPNIHCNHEKLIQAFKKFVDGTTDSKVKLLIVCDESQKDEYAKQVSESKYAGKIIIISEVSEVEQNALLHNAMAFVQPSLYDGIGDSVIKAMFAEVPVICGNTGGLHEIVGGAALMFNPSDVDDICSAMYKITGDEELRHRLVDLGNNRKHDFQNISDMADEYLNVFEETMNEKKAQSD